MGAGIAKEIREHCPNAYIADQNTLWGDKNKLGTFTYGIEENGMIVVNAYTQYDYSRSKICVDYAAIQKVFISICEHFPEYIISLPKIGCGLAGGDWKIVSEILTEISDTYNRTFHIYTLNTELELKAGVDKPKMVC